MTAATEQLIRRAMAGDNAALDALWRDHTGFVSAVLLAHAPLAADVDDLLQDVAVTLFYERTRPDYPDLRAAFEDGYRSVAPWPVTYHGELEHFMAARTVMFVNYVFNIDHDPAAYLDVVMPRLEAFLDRWG